MASPRKSKRSARAKRAPKAMKEVKETSGKSTALRRFWNRYCAI